MVVCEKKISVVFWIENSDWTFKSNSHTQPGLPGPGGGVSAWSGGRGVCLVRGEGCLPGPGGVCLVWGGGFSLPGGVCLPGGSPCQGVSAWSRGVGSAWSGGVLPARGGVCLAPGGSAWSGGFSLPGGVCLVPGGGCLETPPVNRITDTCKNITLATTSLRPVTSQK